MKLRQLNEKGVARFREFLDEVRFGNSAPPLVPVILLSLPLTSEEIPGSPDLDAFPHPVTRYDLARHLHERFATLDPVTIEGADGLGNPGFWAAVSLFYFESLAPDYRGKRNSILADNCYIPELGSAVGAGLRYFRHRLAGAYRIFLLHGPFSQPLLLSAPGTNSAIYNKITDSTFYTETRCIVEAVSLLYFDSRNRKLKSGWNDIDAQGSLHRLLAVVNQLDLTYDLLGIDGETLLTLLPVEFDHWRQ